MKLRQVPQHVEDSCAHAPVAHPVFLVLTVVCAFTTHACALVPPCSKERFRGFGHAMAIVPATVSFGACKEAQAIGQEFQKEAALASVPCLRIIFKISLLSEGVLFSCSQLRWG